MKNFFKLIKSTIIISVLGITLASCQSISTTGTSTYSPEAKKQTSTYAERKAKWDARLESIREKRQTRMLEIRERRLERAEKRKLALKERKAVAEKRRQASKAKNSLRTSYKATQKTKNQSKINRAFGKVKDDKNKSLRVGWVKIDGKFVYRSAKTIKAEQEAAKKAAAKRAAAKKAANKSRRASYPKGNYSKLIAKYAAQHGVPYRLARAVVQVESSFRANATGSVGEIGLMQIRLSTARGMGYKGSAKALYNPATNLYWGMKYLGKAHRLAGGSTCGTILKYNAGHGAKRMNPISRRYCNRVSRII